YGEIERPPEQRVPPELGALGAETAAAAQPRVDWATLLRRSLSVDALECPKCHGRLRVVAVIAERESVRQILVHLGWPTDPPPHARARHPPDDALEEQEASVQVALELA